MSNKKLVTVIVSASDTQGTRAANQVAEAIAFQLAAKCRQSEQSTLTAHVLVEVLDD